ncbi:MAG: PorT family protein [Bacteroidetes bacterium]|nr:PorT family protein [Bacteroidota bacterium]MBS1541855.1 PorT family protein [Bacteroidota bacterium]
MKQVLCFLFLSSILFCHPLLGQEREKDCEQTLNYATAEFEAGRFYGLPEILKQCLERGFTSEQRVRANLLLTQAYLILDDHASAEKSYLSLLKADPEYVANPYRDPVDVYYLSKKFTSTPVFTPYVRMGLNTSFPRYIYEVNTTSNPAALSTNKILRVGFLFGGGVDWNFNERWSLSMGLAYSKKNFKSVWHDGYAQQQLTGIEKQDWIDVPVYLKYSYDSGTIRPFFLAGVAANLLLGARLSPDQVDYNSPLVGSQKASQGADLILTSMRNQINRSLILGGGVKYKVGKNFIVGEIRYMAGLSNLTKSIYTANGQLSPGVIQYQYASPLFRLDNLSISIGYVQPLYNPRKKKRVVAGLLQKWHIKKNTR